MKIIIPMSGEGKRFKEKGYKDFKPLIPITDNHRIIDEVINMFDKTDSYILICNESNTEAVKDYFKNKYEDLDYTIITIKSHKLGPVGALHLAKDYLLKLNDEEAIVTYCDYGQKFNYLDFKDFVHKEKVDCCDVSYTGYHPHLLIKDNVYAVATVDKNNNILLMEEKKYIKHKEHFNHSSGMFYFKSLFLLLKYVEDMIQSGETLNGEYYISLMLNLLIKDKLIVKSYNKVSTFLQMGTPFDFENVKKEFKKSEELLNKKNNYEFENQIMLMAGRSERFSKQGFFTPKAFITINNREIYKIQNDYLKAKNRHYIIADDYEDYILNKTPEYISIEKNKIGPAYSFYKGAKDIIGEAIITSCDIICSYDTDSFLNIKDKYDIIVFATSNHFESLENPLSFSWIDHKKSEVKKVSLKKPLAEKANKEDYLLIGSFYVKENEKFIAIIKSFLQTLRVDSLEYYIDEAINICIQNGMKVGTCLVDGYYSIGSPEEYKKSRYWMEYFNV